MSKEQHGLLKPMNMLPSKKSALKDWKVPETYELKKQIGCGSYGDVAQAIIAHSGKKVAIKRFRELFDDLVDCKRILREIQLLRKVTHPNLTKVIEVFTPPEKQFNEIYMVMDCCQSDLKKLFKSPLFLEPEHVQTIAYNILLGLYHLHTADIIHRDLKPANILINDDCTVKICDFGLSRSVDGIPGAHLYPDEESPDKRSRSPEKRKLEKSKGKVLKSELTSHVVTRWYRAPEVILLEKDYTAKIDVWSFGCIFAELLNMLKENAKTYLDRTALFPGACCYPLSPDPDAKKKGQFPDAKYDQISMIFQVIGTPNNSTDVTFVTDALAEEYIKSFEPCEAKDFRKLFPGSNAECLDLLQTCLTFNPACRPSVKQVMRHPYFASIRNKELEIRAKNKITMDFDEDEELSEKKLKKLFLDEVKLISGKK